MNLTSKLAVFWPKNQTMTKLKLQVCVCLCPPDNRPLQLRLGVMHYVLQNPPQWYWDGQKDKDAGYEPGFTVSPDLERHNNMAVTFSWFLLCCFVRQVTEREAYLVFLQLPDAERQHGHQKKSVENQDQRADPPPPLGARKRHDGCFTLSVDYRHILDHLEGGQVRLLHFWKCYYIIWLQTTILPARAALLLVNNTYMFANLRFRTIIAFQTYWI